MAMTQHEVARTLVKSGPELWEVCSDPSSLGRHLQAFGEIRITRVEPETTVAWEGERASGTVRIEPSGWGTRVTITATSVDLAPPESRAERRSDRKTPARFEPTGSVSIAEAEPELEIPPAGAPEGEDEPVGPGKDSPPAAPANRPRRGLFRRLGGVLFRSFVTPVYVPEEQSPADEAAPEADGEPADPIREPAGPAPEPDSTPEPAPVGVAAQEAEATGPELDPGAVLVTVLDRLGSDHHRPFSRG
jgi:hypothetical protein